MLSFVKTLRLFVFVAIALLASGTANAMHMECSRPGRTCSTWPDGSITCVDTAPVCEQVMDIWDWDIYRNQRDSVWTRDWDSSGNGSGNSRPRTDLALSREVISIAANKPCDETTKRPVAIATGNKLLPEMDFIVPSADEFTLSVQRNYDKSLNRLGIFGKRWASNLERTLSFQYGTVQCHGRLDAIATCSSGGAALSKIYANRTNGFGWEFTPVTGGNWTNGDGATITSSGSGWLLTHKNGSTENVRYEWSATESV